MAQRFEIDAVFRAIDQITDPVRRMSKNVGRAADRMERKLGKVNNTLDKIGSGAGRVGAAVAVGVAAATVALTDVVSVGADFEQVLINAGDRLGGIRKGTEAFEELEVAAISVSSVTEQSASEAAGALEFMGTASENAAVAMGTLKLFADSATAGKVDLGRAAFIAADSIGSLGLKVGENNKALSDTEKIANYTKTVDLMTAAHAGANLTIEDVFETTKKSAGVFRSAGQSLETFFAATQVVSSSVKGAQAGTQLKIVMNNLLKTTGDAAKAFNELRDAAGKKIKLADSLGNIRALPDILEDVNAGLSRFDELKQKRVKTLLFGSEAEAVGTLLLANVDDLRARTEKLNEVMGVTAEKAAVGRDSTAGALKTLASTIEAIKIGVFAVIKDDVNEIVKATTEWAKANKEVLSGAVMDALQFVRDNFDTIVKFGPKILKFVAVLWTLAKVLGVIQTLMAVISALTTVTAASMGLLVIGIIAVVAALALMVIFWDDIVDAFNFATQWMTDVWDALITGIKNGEGVWIAIGVILASLLAPIIALLVPIIALGFLAKTIMDNWSGISGFFSDLWTGISDSFMDSMDFITGALDDVKKQFNDLLGTDFFEIGIEGKGAHFEPIEGLRPANDTFGAIDRGEGGFSGASPQVIDTSSEILERTLTEAKESVSVDVNIKAPAGTVESIDQKGGGDTVKVAASGDL